MAEEKATAITKSKQIITSMVFELKAYLGSYVGSAISMVVRDITGGITGASPQHVKHSEVLIGKLEKLDKETETGGELKSTEREISRFDQVLAALKEHPPLPSAKPESRYRSIIEKYRLICIRQLEKLKAPKGEEFLKNDYKRAIVLLAKRSIAGAERKRQLDSKIGFMNELKVFFESSLSKETPAKDLQSEFEKFFEGFCSDLSKIADGGITKQEVSDYRIQGERYVQGYLQSSEKALAELNATLEIIGQDPAFEFLSTLLENINLTIANYRQRFEDFYGNAERAEETLTSLFTQAITSMVSLEPQMPAESSEHLLQRKYFNALSQDTVLRDTLDSFRSHYRDTLEKVRAEAKVAETPAKKLEIARKFGALLLHEYSDVTSKTLLICLTSPLSKRIGRMTPARAVDNALHHGIHTAFKVERFLHIAIDYVNIIKTVQRESAQKKYAIKPNFLLAIREAILVGMEFWKHHSSKVNQNMLGPVLQQLCEFYKENLKSPAKISELVNVERTLNEINARPSDEALRQREVHIIRLMFGEDFSKHLQKMYPEGHGKHLGDLPPKPEGSELLPSPSQVTFKARDAKERGGCSSSVVPMSSSARFLATPSFDIGQAGAGKSKEALPPASTEAQDVFITGSKIL